MKALIAYASWFGHNRTIANQLASELRRCGVAVACMPASSVAPTEVAGYELLLLGTYTHRGRASQRLRALAEQIPLRRLQKLSIGVFGTQAFDGPQYHHPGGVDDLEACLAARGCDLAAAPLRIELRGLARFVPQLGIRSAERAVIRAFAADVWDASVPAPLI